jgi:hypothetical protein
VGLLFGCSDGNANTAASGGVDAGPPAMAAGNMPAVTSGGAPALLRCMLVVQRFNLAHGNREVAALPMYGERQQRCDVFAAAFETASGETKRRPDTHEL